MKKILTFIFALGFVATAFAIPAKRGYFTVTNSDGTTLTISLRGDETFHFYVTEDGTPVHQDEKGDWVNDERNISALWQEASARRNVHRVELAKRVRRAMRAPRRDDAVADEEIVTRKGLLILVNFADVKFKNSNERTNAIFTQMVNGIGNPYGKNYGSVREYFRDQSYNQFDIEFDVIGPVTVSKEMKYYGENDANGNDKRPGQMVLEALRLINPDVNFADYDWDGDGEVENIYVTYAGYGEAYQDADPNTIWPHQWQLSEATGTKYRADGVRIDTYACGSELTGKSGSVIEGIGVMCHEYSHCLGLPDFYDTNYNGCVEMVEWSIMSGGCNLDNGFTPCGYTAYERWFSGWLEPQELKSACDVREMKPLEDEPEAYIIYNDNHHDEYYMLANHQRKGWDKKTAGHGMMILHVDYNRNAWYGNTVNTTKNHPRMFLINADNELKKAGDYYYADAGDLWPGTKKNTALTDTSTPAASLYYANTDGKKFMHKPITDITEVTGLISFSFMGGGAPLIQAPTELATEAVVSTGFTAQWGAVDCAVSYNLKLTEKYDDGQGSNIEESMSMCEYFDAFVLSDALSDGTEDLKDKLDDYTRFPGWTGDQVYQGIFGVRLGNPFKKGHLTTPVIQGTSGMATVYINAIDWYNYLRALEGNYKPDGSSLDIILQDTEGNELQKQSVAAPDVSALDEKESPEVLVSFMNVPSTYKICMSTTAAAKRVYLELFLLFDGDFTLEEIHSYISANEQAVRSFARVNHGCLSALSAAKAPQYAMIFTTTTYTEIPTNSYVFTNLKPGAVYTYSVQAVDSEGNESSWSDPISVTLPEEADALVAANLDEASRKGAVYDLSGRRRQGVLPRGIYLHNGRKFVVR